MYDTPSRKGYAGGIGEAISKDDAPYKTTDPTMTAPAMTRDSDDDPDHLEKAYGTPARVGKRAKVRRHCARFWCCYLIAIIIFLAIMLPVLFTKIIPALGQRIVDDTDLPIKNATLKALSSDLIQVSLTTSLNVPKGLTVSLDPFSLYMYNPDTKGGFYPYLSLDMERMSLSGETDINIKDQVLRVSNHTELNTWLNRTFVQDSTDLTVQGDTTAHLGAIKMPIHLGKTVHLDGLRNLQGVTLNSIKLVLPAAADGTNIVGNFTMPNWSILTMDLGNITLDILGGDVLVGTATILNVHLPPGNHTMPFRGTLYVPTLVQHFGSLMSSQGASLPSGKLMLGVRGNRSEVAGQRISYLEHVLNNMVLLTEVPVVQLVGDVVDSLVGREPSVSFDGLLGLAGDLFGGDSRGPIGNLMQNLNITAPPRAGGTSSGGGNGGGGGGGNGGLLGQGGIGGFFDKLNITGIMNDTLDGLRDNDGLTNPLM